MDSPIVAAAPDPTTPVSSAALVSVVIITYNGAQWLRRSLSSVLSQSYHALDIIVVEDGSDDGARGIVADMGDARVRYVWQTNLGPNAARNHGIAESRGALVAFLDVDDWWEPGKIERQVAALNVEPDAEWVYSGAYIEDQEGRRLEEIPARASGMVLGQLLQFNCISGSASSVMARRSLLRRAGALSETIRHAEDWEYWLRLATLAPVTAVASLDVGLLGRPGSAGKNTALIRSNALRIIDEAVRTYAAAFASQHRSIKARIEATASFNAFVSGHWGAAIRYLLNAIRLRPTEFVYWKRLAYLLLRGRTRP